MWIKIWDRSMEWAQSLADFAFDLRRYPEPKDIPPPKVVAHRGAWDRDTPENSMAAFERARELGAWAVEFDVQFCKDLVPIVMHDPDFKRTHARNDLICESLSSGLHEFQPPVAFLENALAVPNVHFMIEVKTALNENELRVLSNALAPLKPVQDYHMLTLNPAFVCESPATPARCWFLVGEVRLDAFVNQAIAKGYAGVAGHYLTMRPRHIRKLHTYGLKVGVGFVPSKNLYRREWARGVDWVFTNCMQNLKSIH